MLNPSSAISNYDVNQLDSNIQTANMLTNTQFALDQLTANRTANISNVHRDVAFTEGNVADLVEFMKSLTDPCVKSRTCLAPWVPATSDAIPDALRLIALDRNGTPL
jgi:cytochrome c peroxidase